jgi:hypothetical protein
LEKRELVAKHLDPPPTKQKLQKQKQRDALLKEVAAIVAANPRTMRLETVSAEDEGYSADMAIVTVETAGLSDGGSSSGSSSGEKDSKDNKSSGGDWQKKVRLLLDFGEHGREFVTSEVGLRFLRVLSGADGGAALTKAAGSPARAKRLRALLDACVFKILPLENAAGRDLVEGGRLCERKNGRGVDTNRNWGVDFGVKEKDYDPSEEYPGRAPHSEPEVKLVLAQAQALKPHVWLNVHSGMEALFTPWDHKAEVPVGPGAQASLALLARINAANCGGRCAVGSGGKSVGCVFGCLFGGGCPLAHYPALLLLRLATAPPLTHAQT